MIRLSEKELKPNPYTRLNIYASCMGQHSHDFFEFLIVENGYCLQSINGCKAFHAGQHCVFLIRPTDYHEVNFGTKDTIWRDFYVSDSLMRQLCSTLYDGFYESLMATDPYLSCTLTIDDFNALERKISLFTQILQEGAPYPPGSSLLYKSILIDLLTKMGERGIVLKSEAAPDWLNELYMRLTYYDYATMSAEEIVEKTGFSMQYISHMFRRYYGCTFASYLRKIKVMYSVNLLGKMKIIDIAMLLGWSNPKNYSEQFRTIYGISPKQYAIRLRNHEVL